MAEALTRSAARVYGALSALGSGSPDVLERLLPFFEPILRPKHGQRFDLEVFAKEVRETYKWNFNTDIVEVFVPRLVEAGWLIPESGEFEQTPYTIKLPDQSPDTGSDAAVNEQLREVAKQFKSFSEALSPLTTIPMEVEEFEDILIEWLLYVEAFSEQNLDFKTGVRRDAAGVLRHVVEIPETTSLTDEERFLCARFVQHAIKTDAKTSEVLARIASIGLLTEVVQDFIKPATKVEQSNLVVYLDAPVALELLGVSGSAARDNTQPVVSELERIGASIRIFGQSVDEMKQSMRAVLQNPRPTGPTAQALARGEVLRDYVTQVSVDPEPILEKHGVRVAYRTLEQTPTEHQYFTEEHRSDLYGGLTFQQNLPARDHDTDITTFVMRQRRGYENRDIFRCRALVLTRNGLLAQIVRKRCVELGVLSPSAVPPVVHRRVLTAAMWLRTGLGNEGLEVPKRLLLASCERVLAIRPGVVEAVKRLTDALGDEEKARQLDLLISQDRSAQMLMDKTLGAPSVVTAENLPILFHEMLHPHLEEERKKSDDRLKEARAEEKRRVKEISVRLGETERERGNAVAELETRKDEDRGTVQALCVDVERTLTLWRRAKVAAGLALAVALCIPLLFDPSSWWSYLSLVTAIGVTYLTVTGSKLLSIPTSDEAAVAAFQAAAEKRRLQSQVSRFRVKWDRDHFKVEEPNDPGSGLFA